ncbi:MAG: hypothetical protein AAFO96_05410 [Bacteroidota bacterium]
MKKNEIFMLALFPLVLGSLFLSINFWSRVYASPHPSQPIAQPVSPTPTPAPTTDATAHIQVALLLDISGSMSGLIDQAKGKLWDIVNEMAEARVGSKPTSLEIALYIYGAPHLGSHTGYTKRVVPLTTNLDLISQELFALTTSGGDEYCGMVIQKAVSDLEWTSNPQDLRMIFIAGNESFGQGPVGYAQSTGNANERGILVNTIFCGNAQEGLNTGWAHGATLGKGEYMNIDHNQRVTHVTTPYDAQISEYNSRLNDTYIYYGSQGKELKQRQEVQDSNAESFGVGNIVKRGKSKVSSAYKNKNWDLVDAAEDDDFDMKKIDSETLPDTLQALNEAELKEYVEEKAEERAEIKKEINELYKKREEFVKTQTTSTSTNQLDQAMIQAIRKQGESKGMNFKKD